MDIYYIDVQITAKNLRRFEDLVRNIPNKIGLLYTIQYKDLAFKIKEELERRGFTVIIGKSRYIDNPGQVLGCDALAAINVKDRIDSFLLIGNGFFHPIEVLQKTKKEVVVYDPVTGDIRKYSPEEVKKREIFEKISYGNFLSSHRIGIVITIKPGQFAMKEAEKLKKRLIENGKEVYLFIGDNLSLDEINNFPDIDFWIFVACPRIFDDIIERGLKNAITYDILKKYLAD